MIAPRGALFIESLKLKTMPNDKFTALEDDIANLIVVTVNLEDVSAADIDRQAPLFGDGLGLDSIDALEIGAALSKRYGIKLKAQDENVHVHFESIKSLAEFVARSSANNIDDVDGGQNGPG